MLKNILKKKIPLVALSIEPATLGIGSMNATTTLLRLIDIKADFLKAKLIFCSLFSGLVFFLSKSEPNSVFYQIKFSF